MGQVVLAQKLMLHKASVQGKLGICATQMLESMIVSPRPTRAEVSDVANAVLDGADCVMLSKETAMGMYPFDTVRMMATIIREAESAIDYYRDFEVLSSAIHNLGDTSTTTALSATAVKASLELSSPLIVVLSSSGLCNCMLLLFCCYS